MKLEDGYVKDMQTMHERNEVKKPSMEEAVRLSFLVQEIPQECSLELVELAYCFGTYSVNYQNIKKTLESRYTKMIVEKGLPELARRYMDSKINNAHHVMRDVLAQAIRDKIGESDKKETNIEAKTGFTHKQLLALYKRTVEVGEPIIQIGSKEVYLTEIILEAILSCYDNYSKDNKLDEITAMEIIEVVTPDDFSNQQKLNLDPDILTNLEHLAIIISKGKSSITHYGNETRIDWRYFGKCKDRLEKLVKIESDLAALGELLNLENLDNEISTFVTDRIKILLDES